MSEETVARMRIISSTDVPSVSTVLEEMFQYLDGRVRGGAAYKTIKRHTRLRLALMVLGEAGYARLHATKKPKLLAQTNPDDRMRAYAAQDFSGKWQVELLSP
jgi:hypothetical protein